MRRTILVTLLSCAVTMAASCRSTENPAAAFVDLDGETRFPLVTSNAKANVVVFITVDCPIANGYAPTIRRLAEEFEPRGVRFFLVHVDPDVTDEQARRHAKDFGYESPIVVDRRHDLVEHLRATHTPEAFVIRPGGAIVYRGRINDLYGDLGKKRPAPRTHDLRVAIEAVVAGKPIPVAQTEPVGCFIPEV